MIRPVYIRRIVAVAISIVAIVAMTLFVQLLIFRFPRGGGLKAQMMHRKSIAMHAILDGIIQGDLTRVKSSANQLVDYEYAIQRHLSSVEYEKHGTDFRTAVEDLIEASTQKDNHSAKEAILRLESSCIECHLLMNRQKTLETTP